MLKEVNQFCLKKIIKGRITSAMSRTKDKQENSKEDGTSKTTSAIQGTDVLMA